MGISPEFSMGVHGGIKLDANDELRLGSLCFKSRGLLPEDIDMGQRVAEEARQVASSRGAPRFREEE